MPAAELQTISFPSPAKFRQWLARNHTSSPGIWLRMFKKATGIRSITYAGALEEALCFGWIDGHVKPFDAESWIQRFTPRRPRSNWSKRNTGIAERLIADGRMMPAGLAQIEAAKADGRWAIAYDSPRHAAPPADFLEALMRNKKATAFFTTLNRSNIYAIVYRLQTAKRAETRDRRMKSIIEMLARGETFH